MSLESFQRVHWQTGQFRELHVLRVYVAQVVIRLPDPRPARIAQD